MFFIRSLNYQWGLKEGTTNYYVPGIDKNNFHSKEKKLHSGDIVIAAITS